MKHYIEELNGATPCVNLESDEVYIAYNGKKYPILLSLNPEVSDEEAQAVKIDGVYYIVSDSFLFN